MITAYGAGNAGMGFRVVISLTVQIAEVRLSGIFDIKPKPPTGGMAGALPGH